MEQSKVGPTTFGSPNIDLYTQYYYYYLHRNETGSRSILLVGLNPRSLLNPSMIVVHLEPTHRYPRSSQISMSPLYSRLRVELAPGTFIL